jgi:transposase-like protein
MEGTMAKSKKKFHTPEQKVAILKKHLVEGVPLSDICDQYGLHPSVFYRWQKAFFEKGHLAFGSSNDSLTGKLEKKVSKLEQKLSQKNEVLSELMEEHIKLKKNLGEI